MHNDISVNTYRSVFILNRYSIEHVFGGVGDHSPVFFALSLERAFVGCHLTRAEHFYQYLVRSFY